MDSVKVVRKVIQTVLRQKLFEYDLPIYRCNKKSFEEELSSVKEKLFESIGCKPNTNSYDSLENYFYKKYWHIWRYNEIIGWIKLEFSILRINEDTSFEIIGDLYVKDKIGKNHRNKLFKRNLENFVELEIPINIHRQINFNEIFSLLENEIKKGTSFKKLIKYYFDLTNLKNYLKLLDTKKILNMINA